MLSYPSIAAGAPHWPTPTRSQKALEFVYVIHGVQSLEYRVRQRVNQEGQADLPSTLG